MNPLKLFVIMTALVATTLHGAAWGQAHSITSGFGVDFETPMTEIGSEWSPKGLISFERYVRDHAFSSQVIRFSEADLKVLSISGTRLYGGYTGRTEQDCRTDQRLLAENYQERLPMLVRAQDVLGEIKLSEPSSSVAQTDARSITFKCEPKPGTYLVQLRVEFYVSDRSLAHQEALFRRLRREAGQELKERGISPDEL